MTDRAVAVGREERPDRCIVHYMQPPEPYLGGEDPPEGVYAALRDGSFTRAEAWEMYAETHQTVLDDGALLLENYDADRVAITADHREGFGEWTFYSHNIACPHPAVRRVPCVETTATDEGPYEQSLEPTRNVSADVEDHMA